MRLSPLNWQLLLHDRRVLAIRQEQRVSLEVEQTLLAAPWRVRVSPALVHAFNLAMVDLYAAEVEREYV